MALESSAHGQTSMKAFFLMADACSCESFGLAWDMIVTWHGFSDGYWEMISRRKGLKFKDDIIHAKCIDMANLMLDIGISSVGRPTRSYKRCIFIAEFLLVGFKPDGFLGKQKRSGQFCWLFVSQLRISRTWNPTQRRCTLWGPISGAGCGNCSWVNSRKLHSWIYRFLPEF